MQAGLQLWAERSACAGLLQADIPPARCAHQHLPPPPASSLTLLTLLPRSLAAFSYYWILGRVDDVINVSGHRIGTAEVESALVGHHLCAEAAVVPVDQ